MIIRFLTLIIGLLPLYCLKPILLNTLGHRVQRGARIQMSILLCQKLYLERGSSIGRFNLINVKRLILRSDAAIGKMNFIRGNVSIWLTSGAEIGNRNKITRGYVPGHPQPSQLRLGIWSKLTADHTIDLGDSVLIADNTVLGGLASQIWTHGFIHQKDNFERVYIRGKVTIGKGCFIGSRVCISAGTFIGDNISIGSQSSVSGILREPGAYVSQKLRYLRLESHQRFEKMTPIQGTDNAYEKRIMHK